MGYTLVTSFDDEVYKKLNSIIPEIKANKIPYGRNCNRFEANRKMKYHMTLIHWQDDEDEIYLPKIEQLKFVPFEIAITGSELSYAEEGSLVLYFKVKALEGYEAAVENIKAVMNKTVSSFLHITIAVSQDHVHIQKLKREIDSKIKYPLKIDVTGYDLYKKWNPVELERHLE